MLVKTKGQKKPHGVFLWMLLKTQQDNNLEQEPRATDASAQPVAAGLPRHYGAATLS